MGKYAEELWRDRWCFICRALRRFARAEQWRCGECQSPASAGVAADLTREEASHVA